MELMIIEANLISMRPFRGMLSDSVEQRNIPESRFIIHSVIYFPAMRPFLAARIRDETLCDPRLAKMRHHHGGAHQALKQQDLIHFRQSLERIPIL
jgi:hypothetical protein